MYLKIGLSGTIIYSEDSLLSSAVSTSILSWLFYIKFAASHLSTTIARGAICQTHETSKVEAEHNRGQELMQAGRPMHLSMGTTVNGDTIIP